MRLLRRDLLWPVPADVRPHRQRLLPRLSAGVRGLRFHGGTTVALFPNATLLAAAWSDAATVVP